MKDTGGGAHGFPAADDSLRPRLRAGRVVDARAFFHLAPPPPRPIHTRRGLCRTQTNSQVGSRGNLLLQQCTHDGYRHRKCLLWFDWCGVRQYPKLQ